MEVAGLDGVVRKIDGHGDAHGIVVTGLVDKPLSEPYPELSVAPCLEPCNEFLHNSMGLPCREKGVDSGPYSELAVYNHACGFLEIITDRIGFAESPVVNRLT